MVEHFIDIEKATGSIPVARTMNFPVLLAKLPVIVLLLLSATSVVVGDYFAKSWSTNQKGIFLVIALTGYFFSGIFYIPSLLKQGLVITSIIWSLLSILGFLFIGLVLFQETLSATQMVGVGFGVVALILLAI